jgi:nucleotide-binding universal stress UspA family protein
MIKDLLVPVVLGEPSSEAIASACALAARFGGRVTALVAVSMQTPPSMAWNYFPEGVYETLNEEANSAAEAVAVKVRALLARYPVESETRVANGIWIAAPVVAALHARYFDMTVLGRTPRALPEAERGLFADLLFDTGRPVLVVPAGAGWPESLDRVMVAWRSGPEASRALHDALPLLKLAAAVDVVMVEPKVAETAESALPGAEIAAHLARHGLEVNVTAIPREGQSSGEALLRFARESGTQMIVAGGFGHSRVRQMVFGGVTRSLFEHATVPVLFSH